MAVQQGGVGRLGLRRFHRGHRRAPVDQALAAGLHRFCGREGRPAGSQRGEWEIEGVGDVGGAGVDGLIQEPADLLNTTAL